MAIREKPSARTTNPSDKKALAFINKGGSVAGEKNEKEVQPVNLKIPVHTLESIDQAVKERSKKVPIYRVQWILEAIAEKLEREGL